MSQAGSSPAANPAGPGGPVLKELVLTRIFDAPRSLVFKMWTDPKHLARWWGPHSFTTPVCEMDLRPGGNLRIDMKGPGMPVNSMTGVYREIVEPERLVYSTYILPDENGIAQMEGLTTVTFEDLNGKTKLTLRAQILKATEAMRAALEGMTQGWTETLERLGDVLVNPLDMTPLAARELVFKRFLSAPREKVFDAWTSPEAMGKWWGPNGFKTTTRAMDVRPGGVWDFTMHGPDGRDYTSKIVYLRVERPTFLAYKQTGEGADEGMQFGATVTLGEMLGKTCMTLRILFATAEERDHNVKTYGSPEGGVQTLERLAQFVEAAA